jgi:hypothetical protein
MRKFRDIDAEIQEAEQKLAKLKEERKSFEGLSEEQKLAELIHESQCRWNHTDGCSWYYEKWGDPGYAKKEYLQKANNILLEVPYAQAMRMAKLM